MAEAENQVNEPPQFQPPMSAPLVATLRSLRTLCERCRALGIFRVVVEYSGYGDSGQIDSVHLHCTKNDSVREVDLSDLTEQFEEAAWDLLPGGFENNEGGSGTVEIDCRNLRVTLNHADYMTGTGDLEESEEPAVGHPDYPDPLDENDVARGVAADWLLEHGIQTVTVEYSGSGDEGTVEEIWYAPETDTDIPEWVEEAMENMAYDATPDGFENNEGGRGTITIDLATRTMKIEHANYETAEEHSNYNWDISSLEADPEEEEDAEQA